MSIELLQLIGLILIIALGFKYFFLKSSSKADPISAPSASNDQKQDNKKQ
jgi:predicted exporter